MVARLAETLQKQAELPGQRLCVSTGTGRPAKAMDSYNMEQAPTPEAAARAGWQTAGWLNR